VSGINQVWLADITYIRIRNGFVYLAAILDAYSRRVIGYAISTHLETSLTLRRFVWRSLVAIRHLASSITPTKGCSTLQENTSRNSIETDSGSAWPVVATRTRTLP